jgi:hypothetical protein
VSSVQGNSTVDLTNAEAFQLFSCKLDAALAENKKTILKEFEAKTSALQEKGRSFDFKLEHHKERYNLLSDIQLKFEKIDKLIDFGDIVKVKDIIKKSTLRIKEQKKVIKITDKYGWDVAKEFKDDPITENSEESQRLRQAEARAKRKRSDKRNNPFRGDYKFSQSRYAPIPRSQFGSANWNNAGPQPYRIHPDQCFYCNTFGYWSSNCPLKKRNHTISKPSSTQTSPSGGIQIA